MQHVAIEVPGWESAAETDRASVYEPAGAHMGFAEGLAEIGMGSAEGLAEIGMGSAEGLGGTGRGSSEGPAGSGALPWRSANGSCVLSATGAAEGGAPAGEKLGSGGAGAGFWGQGKGRSTSSIWHSLGTQYEVERCGIAKGFRRFWCWPEGCAPTGLTNVLRGPLERFRFLHNVLSRSAADPSLMGFFECSRALRSSLEMSKLSSMSATAWSG